MDARVKRLLWLVSALVLILIAGRIHDNVNAYYQDILQRCGIAIIMAVSLNIVNGLTGQFSIGHAGFMAIGAYTGADITYLIGQRFAAGAMHHSLPPSFLYSIDHSGGLVPQLPMMLLAMVGGGLLAALFGYAVGVPSLRLRGDYLAIVTLGFGEIIRVLLENTDEMAPALHLGGATGFSDALSLTQSILLFPLIAGTALVVIVLSRNLKFSSHGLAFLSVREDEIAAGAMGVNTTAIKVTAFVLSAFFAGVCGTIYAHAHTIKPDSFNFIFSISFVVMVVLGGTGSITGATLAAIAVTILPDVLKPFRDRYHFEDAYLQVVFALSLVILMIVRPSGVFGTGEISFRRRKGSAANDYLLVGPDDVPGEEFPSGPGASDAIIAEMEPDDDELNPEYARNLERPQPGERSMVLEANDLTRKFGGLTAVGNINIKLEQGELVGLIGPNGAGKTTLFNLLTGVYEPSNGHIKFLDKSLAGVMPYSSTQRAVRLVWDGLLFLGGGWIVGTIMATVLTPYAVTPGDFRIQLVVRWGCVLAALAAATITAPRRRRNIAGPKPYQFALRGISRTFQNIRLFSELTVIENVRIGAYLRRRTNLFDALFQSARLQREEAKDIENARDLLRRFNLTRFENELAKNLPYGDQRRLEIVRALATEPKLLLLDEPAAGMNPQEKAGLMALIRQIRDDFGLTILLIEHDMTLVMGICERIYVLDYGVIIAHGTPEEIRSNPKVIAAYLGEDEEDVEDDQPDSPKPGLAHGSPAAI